MVSGFYRLLAFLLFSAPVYSAESDFSSRLDRLEAALLVVRDYNDDFMSVIVWSLSSVCALYLLLVGFNWFQSVKIIKRDFLSLESDLRNTIKSRLDEYCEQIDSRISGLHDSIGDVSKEASEKAASRLISPLSTNLNHVLILVAVSGGRPGSCSRLDASDLAKLEGIVECLTDRDKTARSNLLSRIAGLHQITSR